MQRSSSAVATCSRPAALQKIQMVGMACVLSMLLAVQRGAYCTGQLHKDGELSAVGGDHHRQETLQQSCSPLTCLPMAEGYFVISRWHSTAPASSDAFTEWPIARPNPNEVATGALDMPLQSNQIVHASAASNCNPNNGFLRDRTSAAHLCCMRGVPRACVNAYV